MNQSVSFLLYYCLSDSSVVPYKVLTSFFLTIQFKQCNQLFKRLLETLAFIFVTCLQFLISETT